MSVFVNYVIATRPWSFTAAVVPTLVAAAELRVTSGVPFLSLSVLKAFLFAICVQAAANLTNTYYDFIHGNDTKEDSGDRALVDNTVSPNGVFRLALAMYVVSFLLVAKDLISNSDTAVLVVFVVGIALAWLYTADPVGLKYRALGDITIFVCFGPLIMQFTSFLLTKNMSSEILPYTIPIGLLTEAILHANNVRDIKGDEKHGTVTLATLVGFDWSFNLYVVMILGSYFTGILIAAAQHWGCVFTLLSVPAAWGLISDFKAKKLIELPEKTAQFHLLYGVLMLLGVLCT